MSFQPALVEQFLSLFSENKEKIRHFPGCHHLELWRDKNETNVFFTYSHWEDEAALENYRHSELFAEVWKNTKTKFNAKPLAWSFDRVDQKLS